MSAPRTPLWGAGHESPRQPAEASPFPDAPFLQRYAPAPSAAPVPAPPPPPRSRANETQIGGEHYKSQPIEPWDYAAANHLDGFQLAIVKYITRWQGKRGVEDLRKARHFLDKYIELAEHGYPNTDPQYFVDQLVAKLLRAELPPNEPEQEAP